MSNKESIEICLGRISDLKQEIREYHTEMKSNPDKAIEHMKSIEDVEIEIVNIIEKINK